MPAESLKSEKSAPIPMVAWPTLMENSPNEGEELKKKAKKNEMETTKPVVLKSRKTCICSPTSHAGSFRCQLHRATAVQNSSSCTSVKSRSQGGHEPILSRFGRASSPKSKPIPQASLPANNQGSI